MRSCQGLWQRRMESCPRSPLSNELVAPVHTLPLDGNGLHLQHCYCVETGRRDYVAEWAAFHVAVCVFPLEILPRQCWCFFVFLFIFWRGYVANSRNWYWSVNDDPLFAREKSWRMISVAFLFCHDAVDYEATWAGQRKKNARGNLRVCSACHCHW